MKILLTFLITLSLNPVCAKHWQASKEVPFELRALISSINLEFLTSEEQVTLNKQLQLLDGLISKLPQSDRYFLGKSAIYKWLLQASSGMRVTETFSLDQLLGKKKSKDLSAFSKWLLGAIQSDIIEISKGPDYQRYRNEKKNNRFTNSTRTIRRKIKLIAPWAFLLSQKDPLQINLQLMRHQMALLRDVLEQYKIYFHFNSLDVPSENAKLSYFNLIETINKQSESKDTEKPLSYLDSIIEKHKEAGLPLPQNDWTIDSQDTWTPGEDSLMEIKVETDGSYIAPSSLPKPVDDWILDY
jgi:hypothetical protein